MSAATKPDALTPKQVAQGLQLHEGTVRRMIRQGRIKAAKFGNDLRIKRAEYEAILENGIPGGAR